MLLAASCVDGDRGVTPPPFDGTPARFFFPVGVAVAPDGGSVYVANSNFDRAFSRGTLLQIDAALFDEAAQAPDQRLDTIPDNRVLSSGHIPTFAGRMTLAADGSALFTPTLEPARLVRAPIEDGRLACPNQDCGRDAVDLQGQEVFQPFAIASGELTFAGRTDPEPALVVTGMAPPSAGLDAEGRNTPLVFIPERLARGSANPFANGAFTQSIGAIGANALAFDPVGLRTFVGGCFSRTDAANVFPCYLRTDAAVGSQVPLRWTLADAGPTAAVQTIDLRQVVGSGEVTDLALSSDGALLYVSVSRPNSLVSLDLPVPGGRAQASVRGTVPLAERPGAMHVIPRVDRDLVAVTGSETGALLIVEPLAGTVVSQIRPIGVGPTGIAGAVTAEGDRLYVTLFRDCAVAAVDVPAAQPSAAHLVSIVGSCP